MPPKKPGYVTKAQSACKSFGSKNGPSPYQYVLLWMTSRVTKY